MIGDTKEIKYFGQYELKMAEGQLYKATGEYEKAEEIFRYLAYDVPLTDHILGTSYAYINLGSTHLKLHKLNEFLKVMQDLKNYMRKKDFNSDIRHKVIIANMLQLEARYLDEIGKSEEAKDLRL